MEECVVVIENMEMVIEVVVGIKRQMAWITATGVVGVGLLSGILGVLLRGWRGREGGAGWGPWR